MVSLLLVEDRTGRVFRVRRAFYVVAVVVKFDDHDVVVSVGRRFVRWWDVQQSSIEVIRVGKWRVRWW